MTAAIETSSWLAAQCACSAQFSRAVELTRPFLMLAGRAHALRGPKAEKLARVNYEEKKKEFSQVKEHS